MTKLCRANNIQQFCTEVRPIVCVMLCAATRFWQPHSNTHTKCFTGLLRQLACTGNSGMPDGWHQLRCHGIFTAPQPSLCLQCLKWITKQQSKAKKQNKKKLTSGKMRGNKRMTQCQGDNSWKEKFPASCTEFSVKHFTFAYWKHQEWCDMVWLWVEKSILLLSRVRQWETRISPRECRTKGLKKSFWHVICM